MSAARVITVPYFPNALCREVDGEIFFADETQGRRATVEAKTVCAGCPDRIPCAEWAIATVEPYGVWGGLTARERQRSRRTLPITDGQTHTEAARQVVADRALQRRDRARQLRQDGMHPEKIARTIGVHINSVKRYLADAS